MASKFKIYWDSCLFFEWLGGEVVDRSLQDGLNEILDQNDAKENIILTSVIADLEVIPEKLEAKKAGSVDQYNQLFDGVSFVSIEINKNILSMAREIRDFYYKHPDEGGKGGKVLDLGDAIHLATAIIYECDEFQTRDGASKGSKVPIFGIYEYSGYDKICNKYELKISSPIADQRSMDV